ncbi:hypothetical protein [Noviherbaspirillum sp. UKPF54]|uniref:hypothetical protein n=1 Tax=Noviherbaspirillum sp. UKPF54 TaxID=2601898 RepID=UPI0011B19627|nr:hypothetical protein [Noviherbaspirillum sp. UKPF54]QDZ27997.1 hypothetical protein FAY22_08575 [Noviherbaspirillum sp. UKPF54]
MAGNNWRLLFSTIPRGGERFWLGDGRRDAVYRSDYRQCGYQAIASLRPSSKKPSWIKNATRPNGMRCHALNIPFRRSTYRA